MRLGEVHHVDLVVDSIDRSLPFYRGLLVPIGWAVSPGPDSERGRSVWYLSRRAASIALRESRPSGGPERLVAGFLRRWRRARLVALEVDSPEVVDERFRWLRDHDVQIASEPRGYGYGSLRYGVSFRDPDGINLELVHVGERAS
jgi:catechol 2,3-dioxygenase-like lactoylglutathione lyase family enzyme